MVITQKKLTDTWPRRVVDFCALGFLPMANQLLFIHLCQREPDNLQRQIISNIFSHFECKSLSVSFIPWNKLLDKAKWPSLSLEPLWRCIGMSSSHFKVSTSKIKSFLSLYFVGQEPLKCCFSSPPSFLPSVLSLSLFVIVHFYFSFFLFKVWLKVKCPNIKWILCMYVSL